MNANEEHISTTVLSQYEYCYSNQYSINSSVSKNNVLRLLIFNLLFTN